jgi:hypothetical protein
VAKTLSNTGSLQTGLTMWHTFLKWAITNIWVNVRKLEEHFNPKGGKMRIQPITLHINQIAFGHFLSQSFHKGVICQPKE